MPPPTLLQRVCRPLADALFSADNQDEAWCSTHFLLHAALRLAVAIRLELLEVMQRIELPVSPPAFGCQDNVTNIKRALISGFFLNVSVLLAPPRSSSLLQCMRSCSSGSFAHVCLSSGG